MDMTPERVSERVTELIEAISYGATHDCAHSYASQTVGYIRLAHELGVIDVYQFNALVASVVAAAKHWGQKVDKDGLRLNDE